ncbi:C6 transcription factor [Neofusicoccum parvum]|nr:C6 transcription factor [Neofusicoccum parvum]
MEQPRRIRRHHRKTRTGCSTCKQRRVKDFGGLQLDDLELLFHFTTATSATVTGGDKFTAKVVEVELPRLAVCNDFLMRAVLAISAMHMASRCQDETRAHSLVSRAIKHHNIGIRGSANMMPLLNETNCAALYCFTALTAALSLALVRYTPRDSSSSSSPHPRRCLFDWLDHVRGAGTIIIHARPWLASSVFAPMISYNPDTIVPFLTSQPSPSRLPALHLSYADEQHLRSIRHFFVRELGGMAPAKLNVLLDALEELTKSCVAADNLGRTSRTALRAVFCFAGLVSEDFMALLRERDACALLVFAHFAVLLQRLRGLWWLDGLGRTLVEEIHDSLAPAYREYMRWPMAEVQ